MSRSLALSVPQPCHESWAAMTPAAQGRYCAACAKTVVDFSRMTDAQVVAHLRTSPSGCGRFRPGQLSRPLQLAPAASVSQRWAAAALAVLGLGATLPAVAQQPRPQTLTQQTLTMGVVVTQPQPEVALRVVQGRVTDADGQGLPGVTVMIIGCNSGTSSNGDGQFALPVPASLVEQNQTQHISFSSIGYFTQQMLVSQFIDQHNIVIQLVVDEKAMSEAVITGGYCAPRWYTPRGLWQRLKQPFRRW